MSDDSFNRRLTAVAGVLLTIFFIVGLSLPGAPPKADDSLREIADFFIDKRGDILAGDFFVGLACLLLLVFAGGLQRHLRASGRGDDGLAESSFGGAVGGVVLLLVGTAVINGIAFKAAGAGQPIRADYDISNALFAMAGFPFALFFGGAAWASARSRAFPAWVNWIGGLAALAQLLGSLALFTKSGFFAGGGEIGFLSPLVGTIWALCLSVLLWRGAGAPAPSGST